MQEYGRVAFRLSLFRCFFEESGLNGDLLCFCLSKSLSKPLSSYFKTSAVYITRCFSRLEFPSKTVRNQKNQLTLSSRVDASLRLKRTLTNLSNRSLVRR